MRQLLILSLTVLLIACATDAADEWKELDLTKYNVPLKIAAPDSAKVVSQTLSGIMHDVTIKSPEDNFDVQVLASRAQTNDMSRLKAEQLESVRDGRYFERVVREEPNGFVFENKIDTAAHYGFRYIVYQGDQEFVFQNGLGRTYDEEQIERMYASIKQP